MACTPSLREGVKRFSDASVRLLHCALGVVWFDNWDAVGCGALVVEVRGFFWGGFFWGSGRPLSGSTLSSLLSFPGKRRVGADQGSQWARPRGPWTCTPVHQLGRRPVPRPRHQPRRRPIRPRPGAHRTRCAAATRTATRTRASAVITACAPTTTASTARVDHAAAAPARLHRRPRRQPHVGRPVLRSTNPPCRRPRGRPHRRLRRRPARQPHVGRPVLR